MKSIDRVVVYTLRDDIGNPAEPADGTTFSLYGIVDFTVEGWDGSSWAILGTVTGNNLVKRTVAFAPFATDRIRVNVTRGLYFKSRIVEIEAYGAPLPSGNLALASAGTVASASSNYGAPFSSVSALNDNERAGANWGNGGGWEDATYDAYPDWVQLDFDGPRSVGRVVLYTLRDDIGNPDEPGDAATFTRYGVRDFDVEGWNGSSWVMLASVTGNNLVKRSVAFAPFTTGRIRVNVTAALYFKSRIVELEAWGAAPVSTSSNVALASAGGVASASSDYGAPFSSLAAVNDNERAGVRWGNGGGWEDGTYDAYPDWLQIAFSSSKTLERVVVYSLRDDIGNPAEPADSTVFTRYGLVDFTVEGWNGGGWTVLGTVTGNNLVKRTVAFAPFTTDRIRVHVTRGLYFKSRIVEIEAWTVTPPAPVVPGCVPVPGTPRLTTQLIASGYDRPLDLQVPPGDHDRLFIVEQSGRIRVIRNGVKLPTPFLDVSARMLFVSSEQGLLGLAFHPQYATNGRFFVNYINLDGDTHISEFRVSSADVDRAEPTSERVLLRVAQPFTAHKGGGLAFGADGMLYASLGDGGSGEDVSNNGQRLDTLLAKMLRIDVDRERPYAIPADNPFRATPGARPEIWYYGLRNPWRFTFDRATRDLFIADVGASQREEVNVAHGGAGGFNYGWRTMEGTACFRPVTGCSPAGLTPPVLEYGRAEGCSIIGGHVYRGCRMPGYHGHYFYADFCTASVKSFRYQGGIAADRRDWSADLSPGINNPSAFGLDADGELYVIDLDGEVRKIVPAP
jgi:glucose/arabinose dehydrogenase